MGCVADWTSRWQLHRVIVSEGEGYFGLVRGILGRGILGRGILQRGIWGGGLIAAAHATSAVYSRALASVLRRKLALLHLPCISG